MLLGLSPLARAAIHAPAAAASSVIFAQDVFSGAEAATLNGHTPEIGGGWAIACGQYRLDGVGGAYSSTGGDYAQAYVTDVPPSADYYVEAVVGALSGTIAYTGVAGRIDQTAVPGTAGNSASDANLSGYVALYRSSNSTVELFKYSGSETFIAASGAVAAPGNRTLRLSMAGTAIKVYWDGAEIISTTDSTFSAAGRVGLAKYGAALTPTTGYHMASFVAATL